MFLIRFFLKKEECSMELLNGKIKPIYFKYLSASFGTALIASVYSIVDVAMVGQYQGPEGTAALAVVAPLWNIIYSLGLLVGIGGSVLFSARRGGGRGDGSENQYFTAAAIGAVILAALAWVGIWCFEGPILTFFGADESLLALAQRYMQPIKPVFPLFLLNQLLFILCKKSIINAINSALDLSWKFFADVVYKAIINAK